MTPYRATVASEPMPLRFAPAASWWRRHVVASLRRVPSRMAARESRHRENQIHRGNAALRILPYLQQYASAIKDQRKALETLAAQYRSR